MKIRIPILLLFSFSIFFAGCDDQDNGLAPYSGSPPMSQISIEQNSYKPKITWIGGYVTALGVNENKEAVLNESLVWLLYNADDQVNYPILYADIPSGALNLVNDYGGTFKTDLAEDVLYTFWAVKGTIWDDISRYQDYKLIPDSNLSADNYELKNDSIFISTFNHTQLSYPLDVYVNLDTNNVLPFGKLGLISLEETKTSNNFNVSWIITQPDITDTTLSAMGLCEGDQYDLNKLVWEIWSEEIIESETVFGKKNVIQGPLIIGQNFDGTRVFAEFPETGLKRNQNYYLWIASKEWDGESRGRTIAGYAYLRFATW